MESLEGIQLSSLCCGRIFLDVNMFLFRFFSFLWLFHPFASALKQEAGFVLLISQSRGIVKAEIVYKLCLEPQTLQKKRTLDQKYSIGRTFFRFTLFLFTNGVENTSYTRDTCKLWEREALTYS